MSKKKPKSTKPNTSKPKRKLPLWISLALFVALTLFSIFSVWYVHHPRRWLEAHDATMPEWVVSMIYSFGNPIGELTDAFDLTGHDAVYEYDEEAPAGEVCFAGVPVRIGKPAPEDIRVLDRGEFKIGWSDSLRHAVWVAYHVPAKAAFESAKRPTFTKDPAVSACPHPTTYTNSGMDRGHMAPNHAIATRFGREMQRATFLMTNITPQSPSLNRGVWKDVEHRISDLWTARYGEIWVIVGCFSDSNDCREYIINGHIEIPQHFYQLIVAQDGMNVRALAVLFDQNVPWNQWAARCIISIDELEEKTGLDFLSELPYFIQAPLEAELPSRLWPVNKSDAFKALLDHFSGY